MLKAIPILILFFFPSTLCSETFYYWIDQEGTHNFTNIYENIPSAYRSQARQRIFDDASSTPQESRAIPQKEVNKAEAPTSQEELRRAREIKLKQQLRQAEEEYEAANRQYLEESDRLIQRRYGSHQQFKSTIIAMTSLRQERDRYKARLIRAKEILNALKNGSEPSRGDYSSAVTSERDTYGWNKAWWLQKMSDLKEKLRNAIDNYEKAYEAYAQVIDKLDPSRFGRLSLTQYQMTSTKLEFLKGELAKYEAEIDAIDQALKKLRREANEAGI